MTTRDPSLTLSHRLGDGVYAPAMTAGITAAVATVIGALGAVAAGRLASTPGWRLAIELAILLLGAVIFNSAAAVALSHAAALGERNLRATLIGRAFRQPLELLEEQGAGDLINRVDDDPAQLATLVRGPGLWTVQGALSAVVGWVVAGITWWPAWFLFPAVGVAAFLLVSGLAPQVAARKVEEQMAWSAHSSQLEESVAARDDIRTSLGQPFVLKRYAELASVVLQRVGATNRVATKATARVGLALNALVGIIAVGGVVAVAHGLLSVSALVTLWMLILSFVGALGNLVSRLPDIQSGIGAFQRIRSLLRTRQEPTGGQGIPGGALSIELKGLSFRYPSGDGLHDISLSVPAGATCALVGRTGSGKSTLVKTLFRAVDPPEGTVFVGGVDVMALGLGALRDAVGVITQRTELLDATLEQNVTLFADIDRERVRDAFTALGLDGWLAGLPEGLDTRLGPVGVTLSAGEEQLVAFARVMVRDARVIVMDEATARMDPQTAHIVTEATRQLLAGRTGILIAHRLAAARHSDLVAVLDRGRLIQHGPWDEVAQEDGAFRELLRHSPAEREGDEAAAPAGETLLRSTSRVDVETVAAPRRPSLARAVLALVFATPRWGVSGDLVWVVGTLLGAYGVVTGFLWGDIVAALSGGRTPMLPAIALAVGVLISPLALAVAARTHPRWLGAITLRLRLAILRGQTGQRRLAPVAAGEVAARALDSTRLTTYVDSWIGVAYGVLFAIITGVAARRLIAGLVAAAVMALTAAASLLGTRAAGAIGAQAAQGRADFGRILGSAVSAAATIKLASATEPTLRHLERVDGIRMRASLKENRIRNIYGSVPGFLVQAGIVVAWVLFVAHVWDIATTLLLTTSLGGFGWFGSVAGTTVTTTPSARQWLRIAGGLAGAERIASTPADVDLVRGTATAPIDDGTVEGLRRLDVDGFTAVHDDGTVGVREVSFSVDAGELVLVVGRIGSGKSSLLAGLAGLLRTDGTIRWNGQAVSDPELFLRPRRVSYLAQIPRIVSGSVRDNIELDHPARDGDDAARLAELEQELKPDGLAKAVGHRGARLSGGQLQRVALARALATDSELFIADDLSSALDAATEAAVWTTIRTRRQTTIASTSRAATLALADKVIVLDAGRVAAAGPWSKLRQRWGHLAN